MIVVAGRCHFVLLTMNVWCDSSIFGTCINLDDPRPQPEESESAAVKCMVTDLGAVTEVESCDRKSFIPAAPAPLKNIAFK